MNHGWTFIWMNSICYVKVLLLTFLIATWLHYPWAISKLLILLLAFLLTITSSSQFQMKNATSLLISTHWNFFNNVIFFWLGQKLSLTYLSNKFRTFRFSFSLIQLSPSLCKEDGPMELGWGYHLIFSPWKRPFFFKELLQFWLKLPSFFLLINLVGVITYPFLPIKIVS
jgi:hypothetical protein